MMRGGHSDDIPTMGGLSEPEPATAEIQKIVNKVKPQLEEKENRKFPIFKAVCFRSQVVAGTIYYIKVDVGDAQYVHLKVIEPLSHRNQPLTLTAYQTNKQEHDELTYF